MQNKTTNFYFNKKINSCLILILLIIKSNLFFAQNDYIMSLEGINVINDSTIEASVYIENKGEELELTSYQCALSINQNIDLSKLELSYVDGTSELLNEPDLYVGIDNIDGPTELTFVSYIGHDIINKKTLIGRFRLKGNVDISEVNLLNIKWDFEGTISTIITGEDFVNITNPSFHESIFNDTQMPGNIAMISIANVESNTGSSSASRVIDGVGYSETSNSRWSQEGLPASLIFDLGDLCLINQTRFSFYNFDNGRIYQYNVKVSTDKENWTTVLSEINSKLEEWSQESFTQVKARYVELELLSTSGENTSEWASVWEAEIWGESITNSVEEEEVLAEESIPSEFGISQNYPNPFNPSTKVEVRMKEVGNARLDVYNILGEKVLSVLDGQLTAGVHQINIDGSKLASGMYIYQLVVNNKFSEVKKMNLMK